MIATDFVPGSPRLAIDVAGDGDDAVVLLHGVGGNRGNWRDQLGALAPRFRAVAPDARGYGDSDDPATPITMADFVADVARVLDHLRAPAAHLVGLSMGGLVAQAFFAAHPSRVRSLVLADTSPGLREGLDDAWVDSFLAARRKPLVEGRTPRDIAPALARSLVSPAAPATVVERVIESLSALRAQSYLAALETVTRWRSPPELPRLDLPVQVIVGAEDSVTPPGAAHALARKIPGARLAVIDGAGHLSNLERPEAFNRVLLEFLGATAGLRDR